MEADSGEQLHWADTLSATTSNGAGLDVPASIIRWNSGRRSLVADAPGST